PDRLRLYANPFRLLFSASPWLAASYLLSYIILSGVLFAVALTVTVATAVLAVTVALVPLLIASAAVVRGCAEVERARLLLVFRQPVRGSYPAAGPGLWRRARRAWSSGATWRDMAYLLGLWVPLFALAVAAIATWLWALAGITLPLWYRFVSDICFGTCANDSVHGVLIGSFPNGPHGVGADGLWIYPSVGPALLVAAGSAVVFLALTYVLVAVARVHGNVARAVLRGASDPLEPARAVLAESGPLGTLVRPPDL
ncbi:MAG: sensor domain-containing protein, partial [Actinobacteria bacterium]|nr:sensor domain-containing protein [Actinomycetota bacterium]